MSRDRLGHALAIVRAGPPRHQTLVSPLQWEMLRQQQGTHLRPLPVDVSLAIYNGRVTDATIRRGTGYSDIDKTIVTWIETRWKTHSWFGGGRNFVISLNVDPAIRQIVFRRS